MSSVLLWLDESGVQRPIYYTKQTLHDAETRYSKTKKIVFALITSAQYLKPYFQAHPIVVLTDQPLRQILQKYDMFNHLIKWIVKLSEFDIQYKPRSTIKSQVSADFIAECTIPDETPTLQQESTKESTPLSPRPWILHVDGSSTPSASGAGIILTSSTGKAVEYTLHFAFPTSNNEAKYEVLLTGLKLAQELGVLEL